MAESKRCWAPLKRELERVNKEEGGWDYLRIENRAMPGTPDLNVMVPVEFEEAWTGIDLWIELKHVPTAPKLGHQIDIGLRKEQYVWLHNAQRAGRYCAVVAAIGNYWYIWDKPEDWKKLKSRPLPLWSKMEETALFARTPGAVVDCFRHLV